MELERLDDRALPSVTLPEGTVWVAPILPPEHLATLTEGLFLTPVAASTAVNPSVLEDEPISNPEPPKEISGSISIAGKSISSAEKGKFTPEGEKERESTDKELESHVPYYMQYDGPTEFKAEYKIGLKPDGSFDPSKSSITLITVNYTERSYVTRKSSEITADDEAKLIKEGKSVVRRGDNAYIFSKPKLVTSGWKTLSIPITEATLKEGKLLSFKFKSDTWYPEAKKSGIIDKGISGEIDLVTAKASFTAKYQSASTGVIATYDVEGMIKESTKK